MPKTPGLIGESRSHPTRLRAWRVAAGFTLDDVSGLSGVSTAMLSRGERGERVFAPATKVRLARSLGVAVADLFEPDLIEVPA